MKKILLVFGVLLISVAAFSQKKKEAEQLVDDGVKLYDKGDYATALLKYDQALELDKDNFLAMAEKALTLNALSKFEESAKICEKIVDLHSNEDGLATVYVTWGNSMDGLREADKAIEVYDKGIELFPNYYALYFNKGITYAGLKDYEEALGLLNKSTMLNPNHSSSHNATARLLYGNNRIASLLAFLRYLALDPTSVRAKSNLEIVREMLQQNVEKTGKKSISITVDGKMLADTTEDGTPNPNNFSSVDLVLTLQCALDLDKSNKKKTEVELFIGKLKSVCESLKEGQEKNSGFYWNYYAPYFIEMHEKEMIETFAYIVYFSSSEKYVSKWIEEHKENIKSFYKWSETFPWYTEE